MSTKHTPGPWVVDGHPRRDYPRVTDSRGYFVADCNEEDARLIAAAPELLAALADLQGWCCGYEADKLNPLAVKYINAARAAIAKATGEQQ